MNREEKEKLDLLLKRKVNNDGLNRCLDLYKKIDDFIEAKPTLLDEITSVIRPQNALTDIQLFDYKRTDIPGCDLHIETGCDEVVFALRDWYRKKALELAEQSNG
jgi:hypothetical protein